MVIVDLITGFLGAGKTTFIHKYLHHLQAQGLRVQIIENEFGDVSVDSELLRDEDCEIHDLSGLCMCCVGKDAFIRMLKESAVSGCDRIIVEPSGIYDVDEFFEVLSLPEISEVCEIGSIITIVDPQELDSLTAEAEYLAFGQLLASGAVLFSKMQLLPQGTSEETREKLLAICEHHGCENGFSAEIYDGDWKDFTTSDYDDFMDAGYMRVVHDREIFNHSEIFQSVDMPVRVADYNDLEDRIRKLFSDGECGVVYRVKGYASDLRGQNYEVNCTAHTFSIEECGDREGVLVVIGQKMKRRKIREII